MTEESNAFAIPNFVSEDRRHFISAIPVTQGTWIIPRTSPDQDAGQDIRDRDGRQ